MILLGSAFFFFLKNEAFFGISSSFIAYDLKYAVRVPRAGIVVLWFVAASDVATIASAGWMQMTLVRKDVLASELAQPIAVGLLSMLAGIIFSFIFGILMLRNRQIINVNVRDLPA